MASANVVGYQYIEIPAGYNLFTPTFNGVATELDVTTIAVCDADGNELDLFNDVTMQKMDDTGAYLDGIAYSPTFGGWNIDFAAVDPETFTFKPGETVCIGNESGGKVYLRVSGQVDLVNLNKITSGYVLWGNGTPVPVDFTQIQVVDADGVELDLFNDVTFQKMDDTGAYLDGIAYSPTFGGWNVDFTAIEEGDFVLQPGEAGCVGNESGAEVYFKLPSPIK